jgi:hypothetical protein
MALSYSVDATDRLVLVSADATPTVGEIEDLILAVPLALDFGTGFGFLCDCRAMRRLFDADEMKTTVQLIQRWQEVIGKSRCAIVVPPGRSFALARLFAMLVSATLIVVNVFYTVEEARRWLSQPDGAPV